MSVSAKHNEEFVLAVRPKGTDDLKNIWKLQPCDYPAIKGDNQFIAETLYVSVDPYLSSLIRKSALGGAVKDLGTVQISGTVAKVIESTSEKYPVGTVIQSYAPWKRFYLVEDASNHRARLIKKPGEAENIYDKKGYGVALGGLGMPSMTAYYGVREVGKYTKDDVVVVSGAAGAVGTIVGQICKNVIGCKKVIGVAGGKHKCDLLTSEFGYDASIDYKDYNTREKMAKRLAELAGGEGQITAYFENTGGHTTEAVFDVIARHGRVQICGQISAYNDPEEKSHSYPNYLAKSIYKALTLQGFVVGDYMSRNEKEFDVDMPKWVQEGKVKIHQTVVEGFEKLPQAYNMLFTGENIGKIVVKV